MWVTTCYLPYEELHPPDANLRSVVAEARRRRIPIVIGADANAHNQIWGSMDTNPRGESLFDFILCGNLHVLNEGNVPTFYNATRREVIDITLVSADHREMVANWRVSPECSLSDHAYITYELVFRVSHRPTLYRNRRKTNWDVFRESFGSNLGPAPAIATVLDLENAVEELTCAYNRAAEDACEIVLRGGRPRPCWWSADIAGLRRECRRSFNAAKRSNDWTDYKSKLSEFKRAVRRAKRSSWKLFCGEIVSSGETSRLRRILSKSPSAMGSIVTVNGGWTDSEAETVEVLIDTHFPGNSEYLGLPHTLDGCMGAEIPVVMNDGDLTWAIDSFSRFKSPGPDGIIPADIQETRERAIPWLLHIYRACLGFAYIPRRWRESKVVFVPKAGKTSHSTARDFRPISLSSFLLKILERLIDRHIRSGYLRGSWAQHAYTRGRSTESALSSLVGFIERALHFKQFCMAAFVDIEGAFNNIRPQAIIEALAGMRVDECTTNFIGALLGERFISSPAGGTEIRRRVHLGTPQGGVLSPLLWNLAIEGLLTKLMMSGFKVVGYADDLAIAISGSYPQTLSERLNVAFEILSNWSRESGLGVNPQKTKLVLFTRRYKIPEIRPPRLEGVQLDFSPVVKYLGVILDSKLSWRQNVMERARKAYVALYACRQAVGKRWGLKPFVTNWLYRSVVEPVMLYGAAVWWEAVSKGINCRILDGVRRQSAILITGALRTTPTKALYAMLNWLPTELLLKQRASLSAIRLNSVKCWPGSLIGHSRAIHPYSETVIDYTARYDGLGVSLDTCIPDRDYWDAKPTPPPGSLEVYTDGSRMCGKTGCGVYIESLNVRNSYRLPDHCSVFQAEVTAILLAIRWLLSGEIFPGYVLVYSDSQAAIRSLARGTSSSKLVHECRALIGRMAAYSKVSIIWVPGHRDIPGNCIADELARAGTELDGHLSDPFIGVPLAALRLEIGNRFFSMADTLWMRESTCSTARLSWPNLSPGRTGQLIYLSRTDIYNVVSVLTGHCLIGRHALRLGAPSNDLCRSCGSEEEEETVLHLMCNCPALARRRCRWLGSPFLTSLTELSGVPLRDIARFIRESGWFRQYAPS